MEKIGVEKSLSTINDADLVIHVLNNNEPLTKDDTIITSKLTNKTHITFINKNDLKSNLKLKDQDNIVYGNTITPDGLNALKTKIIELFDLDSIATSTFEIASTTRVIALIKESLNYINNALNNINENTPVDMLAIDIKAAYDTLGEIIGETYQDELLDTLFSKFCLGK